MKKILLVVLFFICSECIVAQRKKPSELHKEKLEQDNADKWFDQKDEYFEDNTLPEKWKNESAVILAQKFDYKYTLDGRNISFIENRRRKIKLIDKAAVDAFSEFYYYQTGENFKVGIRVIKADGSIKNVNLADAVTAIANVPDFFQTRIIGYRVNYKKIAIPDLEPGDVIDYFQEIKTLEYNSGYHRHFEPIYFNLNNSYPVVKQRLDFSVERGFFVNFKSLYGAPELTKTASDDRRMSYFNLVDKDRDATKEIRWLYKYRCLPLVKFQVIWEKLNAKTYDFLGKPGEPIQSVSSEWLSQKMSFRYFEELSDGSYMFKDIYGFMKNKHPKVTDPAEYVMLCYYYYRKDLLANNTYRMDHFIPVMREILKKENIESQVVVSSPRSLSSIDSIVMNREVSWFLKVGDKYLYTPGWNSNIYESDYNLEGCDAYIVDVNKKTELVKYEKTKIPVSNPADNLLSKIYEVKIDDNMEILIVNSNITIKGSMKRTDNEVLRNTDYLDEDYKIYGGDPLKEIEKTSNKVLLAEMERQEASRLEDQKKSKLAQMKESLKDDFGNVVSYDEFNLTENGRSYEKPVILYTEKFKLGDKVNRAGSNYSVDLGSMIGSQVEIMKNEMKRDFDAYTNFPKTLENKISFTLPAGYKAEGLEALNISVDNNVGSFISSTSVNGDVLTLNVSKVYKTNFVKKEDWSKMVEFLDAAFNFTQKKIILKKV